MYDLVVDIASTGEGSYASPDGMHSFSILRKIDRLRIPGLVWGTACSTIPFFTDHQIIRFMIHEKRRTPLVVNPLMVWEDDLSLCRYLGRKNCAQFGDAPFMEIRC